MFVYQLQQSYIFGKTEETQRNWLQSNSPGWHIKKGRDQLQQIQYIKPFSCKILTLNAFPNSLYNIYTDCILFACFLTNFINIYTFYSLENTLKEWGSYNWNYNKAVRTFCTSQIERLLKLVSLYLFQSKI